MIFNSLFFQIILAVLAVAIGITYVQPTFNNIGEIQNAIGQYKEERDRVEEVNNRLAGLVSKVNGISAQEQRALLTYMPEKVDTVSVSRDIYNLTLRAGVTLENIKYNPRHRTGAQPATSAIHLTPAIPHMFDISISGNYDQLKSFMLLLEQNNYPLEIHSLNITTSDDSILSAGIEIITYSRI